MIKVIYHLFFPTSTIYSALPKFYLKLTLSPKQILKKNSIKQNCKQNCKQKGFR